MTLCRRYGYLDVLNPEPKEKREVADTLGKSPSTAYKHLKELAESNVIERTEEGYALTKYGEVVRAKLRQAERAYDAEEVIEAFDAPPEILSQGEFVPSRKYVPNSPIEQLGKRVDNAEKMRGLVPVLFPRYLDFYHGQILDGLDAEFVVEREVFEYIRDEHAEILRESVEHGTRYFVTDDELPHGLALLDEVHVGVLVYDDDGHVLGYASFASPRARKYFEEVYENHMEGAERFEP